MKSITPDWDALRACAMRARPHAYAPYSKFPVSAAVLTTDGRIFAGVNVENASFGLTVCAERNAVYQAVAAGARSFAALLLLTDTEQPTRPCGACRQVLVEFPPEFPIRCETLAGGYLETSTSQLLPDAFDFAPPSR